MLTFTQPHAWEDWGQVLAQVRCRCIICLWSQVTSRSWRDRCITLWSKSKAYVRGWPKQGEGDHQHRAATCTRCLGEAQGGRRELPGSPEPKEADVQGQEMESRTENWADDGTLRRWPRPSGLGRDLPQTQPDAEALSIYPWALCPLLG